MQRLVLLSGAQRFAPVRRFSTFPPNVFNVPKSSLNSENVENELFQILEKEPSSKKEKESVGVTGTEGLLYRTPIHLGEHIRHLKAHRNKNFLSSHASHMYEETIAEVSGSPLNDKKLLPENCPPAPRLAHGLERVIQSPGIHTLRDLYDNSFRFTPFLQRIHQPEEICWENVNPFVPTSQDESFHALAVSSGVKFKGSTSSVSGLLSHLYLLLSSFRPLNLSTLSSHSRQQNDSFSRFISRPSSVFLRPRDGVYSVDSEQGVAGKQHNTILLELGKSLERMLTMEQEDFEKNLLLAKGAKGGALSPDTYHFLRSEDILLRSQIDCADPSLGDRNTFDLKTRATWQVRVNIARYKEALQYKLNCLTGTTHSYEREFYDMLKGAFLKYYFQVRIGNMDGIFVAYHNTDQFFGFEYIKAEELSHLVFGSVALGSIHFSLCIRMMRFILRQLTSKFDGAHMKVTFGTLAKRELDIFVELVPKEQDQGWSDPNDGKSSALLPSHTNPIHWFSLSTEIFHNKKQVNVLDVDVEEGDDINVCLQWREMKVDKSTLLKEYRDILLRSSLWGEVFDQSWDTPTL